MTTATSRVLDDINDATGYANGVPMQTEAEVRAYFTVANMARMFGADGGWKTGDQHILNGMAECVIKAMVPQRTVTKLRGYSIVTEPRREDVDGVMTDVVAWIVTRNGEPVDDGYGEDEADAMECAKSAIRAEEYYDRSMTRS